MAENLDIPSFSNFSIESTEEAGIGDTDLIRGLYSSDSATTDPDDITSIEEEEKTKVKKPAPKKAAPKAAKPVVEDEEEQEEEKQEEEDVNPIDKLLNGGEEDEEEEEEEEPVKPKGKKQEEEEEEEEGEETSANPFSALAKDLFKLGVFTQDEDEGEVEISTPEQFLERFNLESKKRVGETLENFLGQFGEDYKKAFQAIYINGVNPKEYFGIYNTIEDFASLDMAQEDNQVAVMRQALTDQGLEPEDITKEIEKLKNYGDLEETAARFQKVLVKKQAQKLAEIEQENAARLQQMQQMKAQYIKNVQTVLQEKLKTKEFDGIPLNPKLAGELQDFLITDKYKTPSGETLTEFDRTILDLKRPENHEKKVKVALLLKLLEKDPTLSTIKKKGISQETNTLFSEVARQSKKTSVKTSKQSKPTSWFL